MAYSWCQKIGWKVASAFGQPLKAQYAMRKLSEIVKSHKMFGHCMMFGFWEHIVSKTKNVKNLYLIPILTIFSFLWSCQTKTKSSRRRIRSEYWYWSKETPKIKKKRVLSSSEDDEYDQLSSKLKPFPKVKILQTYDHEKNNVERDEITTPSLLQSLTPTASCSSGQDSRSVSSTDTFLSDEGKIYT